jgi:SAM-dependent methyltransferase
MNINLGCGDTRMEDAVNVDFRQTDAVDVRHDLSIYPWPFDDNEFNNVHATDIIEHMLWVVLFIDECWRIVKPTGHLYIRTTYFRSEQSYKDPTHLHFFTLDSFDFFDPDTDTGTKYPWYSERKWTVVKKGISGQETVFDLQKR